MRQHANRCAFLSTALHGCTAGFVSVVVITLFSLFLSTIPTQAQSLARLEGTLTDAGGAAVSGAEVALQEPSAPASRRQVKSTNEGRFQFEVPPGHYRLTIDHALFQHVAQELALAAGESRELRVSLAIEPLSENIVVSAAAQPIPAAAASEPVDIITEQEIAQRQATQLGPLLATLPGFSFGQTGPAGGVASLWLDGGNSNFTKVLVDGVPVNQPGGAVDFSNFTLDNVDKIEVVHGAQSALAGSDAVTGTIEILTHRGSTRVPLLLVESDGGSFSTGRSMAQLSGVAGPFDYSAAAAYFETQGQGVNDRFLNRTLSGNFGVRLSGQDSLRLTFRSNVSDAGEPGQTLFTPPNLDAHNSLHNIAAGLSWDFATGAHWQHRVFATESDIHQLFQNKLSDFFIAPDPFGSCSAPRSRQAVASAYCDFPYDTRNQYNRANLGAQSTYLIRQSSVTAGYQYEVENAFVAFLNGVHARRNNQAGFVDGRWQATDRMVINAGFRIEDNASFGTRVVPRAGLSYTLRHGGDVWGSTRLRFTFGQGIKEPRLDQSFGTDLCNPGNPALRPEQSRAIRAGVDQRIAHDRIRVSAEYFDSRFRDLTSFAFCFPGAPCPVTPPAGCPFGFGSYFNTDLARARGAHFTFETQLTHHISLSGNYAYHDTRVIESPNAFDPAQAPGNRLIRRPVNSGNIMLNAALGRFNGNIATSLVGQRTDSDFLFPSSGLTSNPGYVRVDLAMSFRVSAHATFIGRVQNLFNAAYQDVLGYPALGRGAYIGVRFRLGGDE
jgi:vitamin B12 transporter